MKLWKLLVYNCTLGAVCSTFVWFLSLCFKDAISGAQMDQLRILLAIGTAVPGCLILDGFLYQRRRIDRLQKKLAELTGTKAQ